MSVWTEVAVSVRRVPGAGVERPLPSHRPPNACAETPIYIYILSDTWRLLTNLYVLVDINLREKWGAAVPPKHYCVGTQFLTASLLCFCFCSHSA